MHLEGVEFVFFVKGEDIMGLIKSVLRSATSSVSGVLADQWKEYISLESMSDEVLMCRGHKNLQGRSGNGGNSSVISDGSGISVADGQCFIIVEQGKVIEFCAEPGVYTYYNQEAPSIFTGDFGDSLSKSIESMKSRFTMGGGTAGIDQRVYFFNLKEIKENRFGTPTPIPFRVVGRNHSFDLDTYVKCNGQYSYRMVDPLLFYMNVSGNASQGFHRQELESTLKSELLTALQPAFARISQKGIRHSELPYHSMEIAEDLKGLLSKSWTETRGIQIVSFSINSASIPKEDAESIRQLQLHETPHLAATQMAAAQTEALKNASSNSSGAMHGFLGMQMATGMANQMQGNSLYREIGQQQEPVSQWQCSCGESNTGKFCQHCGKGKAVSGWVCTCGARNPGNYCQDCGQRKPDDRESYCCNQCGFIPENPEKPSKFCPECGDIFDENDKR